MFFLVISVISVMPLYAVKQKNVFLNSSHKETAGIRKPRESVHRPRLKLNSVASDIINFQENSPDLYRLIIWSGNQKFKKDHFVPFHNPKTCEICQITQHMIRNIQPDGTMKEDQTPLKKA